MSSETRDPTAEIIQGNVEAVRETVAEWLRHHAGRVEDGSYVNDLPDTVEQRQDSIRELAHLALQATGVVHRLTPEGLEAVADASSRLDEEVEAAVSDAFAAADMNREIPDDFLESALEAASERLSMVEVT